MLEVFIMFVTLYCYCYSAPAHRPRPRPRHTHPHLTTLTLFWVGSRPTCHQHTRSSPERGWHCTWVSRAEDARQQPMDKVLFMIYGITWLIGVSLPLLVLCIYRTLQQIRCLPALNNFWPSAIVFGSLLFLCTSTNYHIWALLKDADTGCKEKIKIRCSE